MWQRDNYQPERGSLKSFLGLLTRHRAIDKLRKRNTTQKFLARWQLNIYENSSSTLPLEEAQSQEQQKQLQKALSLLPVEQREILMMNFFEGLSRAQIAEKLNLPELEHKYLPSGLQLMLLDSDGDAVMEATTRQDNKNLKFEFTGTYGEAFSIKLELFNNCFQEDFIL